MKTFYFLAAILFSFASYSQNCNIGNQQSTPAFTAGNMGQNYLLGTKHSLSEEGTLISINMIGNGTASGIQMAVYSDNNGVPFNLVASSSTSIVGNGITSLPVTPTDLSPGDYWIMAVYNNSGNETNVNISASGNVVYYQDQLFGSSLPTNASGFLSYTGQDFLYFLEINCAVTSAVEPIDLSDVISIYPTITKSSIQVLNLNQSEKYEIYNSLGAIVLSGTISDKEVISVQNLSNGIYYLKFENRATLKFIKE